MVIFEIPGISPNVHYRDDDEDAVVAPATPYDGGDFLDDLRLALEPPDDVPAEAPWYRPITAYPKDAHLELYAGAYYVLAARLLARYDAETALLRFSRFRIILDFLTRHYARLESQGRFVVGPTTIEADEEWLRFVCNDVLENEAFGHGAHITLLQSPGKTQVRLQDAEGDSREEVADEDR